MERVLYIVTVPVGFEVCPLLGDAGEMRNTAEGARRGRGWGPRRGPRPQLLLSPPRRPLELSPGAEIPPPRPASPMPAPLLLDEGSSGRSAVPSACGSRGCCGVGALCVRRLRRFQALTEPHLEWLGEREVYPSGVEERGREGRGSHGREAVMFVAEIRRNSESEGSALGPSTRPQLPPLMWCSLRRIQGTGVLCFSCS